MARGVTRKTCPECLPFTLNKLLARARDWCKETLPGCAPPAPHPQSVRGWGSGVWPTFCLVSPVTLPCLQIGIGVRKLFVRCIWGSKSFRRACCVSRVCGSDRGCACELQAHFPCKDKMLTELGQSQTKWLKSHTGCWLCGCWYSYGYFFCVWHACGMLGR